MSILDQVNGFIATDDKNSAIALLASTLIKNKNDPEAWRLLGDLIEDPPRKKQCYGWVLRLCPDDAYALAKLQELEGPPAVDLPIQADNMDDKLLVEEERPTLKSIPKVNFSPPASPSKGLGIIGYVLGGIGAFLLILNVIANPDDFSNGLNVLYVGLIFIGLIAGTIILSVSNKNRG